MSNGDSSFQLFPKPTMLLELVARSVKTSKISTRLGRFFPIPATREANVLSPITGFVLAMTKISLKFR